MKTETEFFNGPRASHGSESFRHFPRYHQRLFQSESEECSVQQEDKTALAILFDAPREEISVACRANQIKEISISSLFDRETSAGKINFILLEWRSPTKINRELLAFLKTSPALEEALVLFLVHAWDEEVAWINLGRWCKEGKVWGMAVIERPGHVASGLYRLQNEMDSISREAQGAKGQRMKSFHTFRNPPLARRNIRT